MAGERVVPRRGLNRALLARQLLLERARTPLPRALERVGGIQAQYAPSMYVGLWSRLEDFERGHPTHALERRSVVQGTLMRATIHLVSPGDYRAFAAAVRGARRAWWMRAERDGPDAAAMAAAARRLRGEDGEELIDLPRAPLPDPETPAPVRFLPTWDASLLVHARRTGLLAGSWRHVEGRIELDPFEPLDAATRRALRDEADRLVELHR